MRYQHFLEFILDLAPNYVTIHTGGQVTIEMLGGTDHCGVQAYPEDYEKLVHRDFKFGDTKLLDGLWYYDQGYEIHGPQYENRVERLRPKQ